MTGPFPEQSGGSPGCLPVLGAIALLVTVTCAFFMAQGTGFFDAVGTVGSAIIEVIDELWEQ